MVGLLNNNAKRKSHDARRRQECEVQTHKVARKGEPHSQGGTEMSLLRSAIARRKLWEWTSGWLYTRRHRSTWDNQNSTACAARAHTARARCQRTIDGCETETSIKLKNEKERNGTERNGKESSEYGSKLEVGRQGAWRPRRPGTCPDSRCTCGCPWGFSEQPATTAACRAQDTTASGDLLLGLSSPPSSFGSWTGWIVTMDTSGWSSNFRNLPRICQGHKVVLLRKVRNSASRKLITSAMTLHCFLFAP